MNGMELRNLRQSAGVAMADLAGPLGLSEVSISRIERGTQSVPEGFADRYQQEVQNIARRRLRAAEMVSEEYRSLTDPATLAVA